jgi:Zn-dependent peptidase ImmA (M78 family)
MQVGSLPPRLKPWVIRLLRRGFKSQCERSAVEVRRSFNLQPSAPLLATTYAKVSGVVVWSDQDIIDLPEEDRRQLTIEDPESWSAFVIRIEQRHLIVYNSSQSEPRINSVIMHELSHILLGHKLTSAGISSEGYLIPTIYDQDQEDEANWMAGTLLLPRPALLRIRNDGLTDNDAMSLYSVSKEMMQWRFRMTGVDYQMGHQRRRSA